MRLVSRVKHGTAALFAVTLLCVGFLQVRPASADISWCFDDPVVNINGIVVNTVFGVQADAAQLNNGSHAFVVYSLPAGVSAALISDTNSYFKEHVSFVPSGAAWTPGQPVPVTVTLTFNQNHSFPAQMTNTVNNRTVATASGTADGVLTASFSIY